MAQVKPIKDTKRWHFYCPGCGHHMWFDERWVWNNDINAPTVIGSILWNPGKANPTEPICHLWITNGKIIYCNDCTHKLKGKTIEMEDIDNPFWWKRDK